MLPAGEEALASRAEVAIVEDLAARYRARWGPACYPLTMVSASGEWSCAAEQVLEALIAQHGAPLVLKADNGSAFIAKRFASFCRSHGIALVHSPVRRPQFNGCCEVSGKHAKRRAQAAAAQRGAVDYLSAADLQVATTFVGEMPRVPEALRADSQQALAEQLRRVAAERGVALGPGLGNAIHRSLGPVAAVRALIQCHILSIQGCEYLHRLSPAVA